jgi:photosystem II stability/assembly factor-like uncharacterized protein
VLATMNGGSTWAPQLSNCFRELYDVAFGDTVHGWAVGAGGAVVATADDGASWTPQSAGIGFTWVAHSSGTDKNLRGVTFVDAACGWACGQLGVVPAAATGDAPPPPAPKRPGITKLTPPPQPGEAPW